MTLLFAFIVLPFLSMTGIYNPDVMRHGHCIAEPGTIAALYCHDETKRADRQHSHR